MCWYTLNPFLGSFFHYSFSVQFLCIFLFSVLFFAGLHVRIWKIIGEFGATEFAFIKGLVCFFVRNFPFISIFYLENQKIESLAVCMQFLWLCLCVLASHKFSSTVVFKLVGIFNYFNLKYSKGRTDPFMKKFLFEEWIGFEAIFF